MLKGVLDSSVRHVFIISAFVLGNRYFGHELFVRNSSVSFSSFDPMSRLLFTRIRCLSKSTLYFDSSAISLLPRPEVNPKYCNRFSLYDFIPNSMPSGYLQRPISRLADSFLFSISGWAASVGAGYAIRGRYVSVKYKCNDLNILKFIRAFSSTTKTVKFSFFCLAT